jgi:hypothetical protein
MKHSNHTFYPEIKPAKTPLFEHVLRVLYTVAGFTVFILIWTGL